MSSQRPCYAHALIALSATAVFAPLGASAAQPDAQTAQRERGLSRFQFVRSGERAIPQCIKAPAVDAPIDNAPLVFDDLALPPAAVCFSAENPPSLEVQAAINRLLVSQRDRFQILNRWSGGGNNTPRALTWSFVPDGTSIPASGNASIGDVTAPSNLFAQMDAKFGGIANRAVWVAQFQACFDRWSALTGTSYTFVSTAGNLWDDGAAFPGSGASATRGDIRISMKALDGASNVLAYNFFPDVGDMVLDSAEGWAGGAPSYLVLRNVLMHEHGHGLGLRHNCPINQTVLMEPFLTTAFDGPQQDDVRAIAQSYGDAYEPNDALTSPTPIGNINTTASLNPSNVPAPAIAGAALTAISVDGDIDLFSVQNTAPAIATVTLTPIGSNYQSYPQNGDGTCATGAANTNALAQADLTLDVLTDAGTVLRSATPAGAGNAETLTGVLISGNANIIRVAETGTPTQSQMYTLSVVRTGLPTITASDGTSPTFVSLGWTGVTGATGYQVLRNSANNLAGATVLTTGNFQAFNDTTALPGVPYFYWVNALFGTEVVFLAGPDQGSRQLTAPSNDACPGITVNPGDVIAGSLVGATPSAAALAYGSCGSAQSSPDVWYTFRAPATCGGVLTVTTCGTHDTGGPNAGIDTVLSFVGDCFEGEVACNDDFSGCAGAVSPFRDSSLSLALTPNQLIRIRVATFNNAPGGLFTLNVTFAPANDLCANATPVLAGAATAFCNLNANTDGPTDILCNNANNNTITNDLWYTYTPVGKGRFVVDACASTFDTKLAVYASACPAGPDTALACNDDACGQLGLASRVSAIGVAGTTYRIRVGGYNGATGSGSFTVFCAGDYNRSGTVSVQDIFDFLSGYFSSAPDADINGVNGLSVQDIFDFLATYFAGC